MDEFISEQIFLNTAEDEANYFTGQPESPILPDPNAILPAGIYRVIDGTLYRVVRGAPPELPLTRDRRM